MTRYAFLFVAITSSACALVRPITASNGDAADHRSFVLAPTEGARLARASSYLERHPDGAWSADLRAVLPNEEPAYYTACTKSRESAIGYLAWLPHGPHAESAFALVRSFDEHEPEDEQSRMLKAARENEQRMEHIARDRAAAHDALFDALRLVVDPAVYGRALVDSPSLSKWLMAARNFGATPTRRTRTLHFTTPSPKGAVERDLELTVEALTQAGDVVTSTTISGPALFTRAAELALVRVESHDAAERYMRDAITALAQNPKLRIDLSATGDVDRIIVAPSSTSP